MGIERVNGRSVDSILEQAPQEKREAMRDALDSLAQSHAELVDENGNLSLSAADRILSPDSPTIEADYNHMEAAVLRGDCHADQYTALAFAVSRGQPQARISPSLFAIHPFREEHLMIQKKLRGEVSGGESAIILANRFASYLGYLPVCDGTEISDEACIPNQYQDTGRMDATFRAYDNSTTTYYPHGLLNILSLLPGFTQQLQREAILLGGTSAYLSPELRAASGIELEDVDF